MLTIGLVYVPVVLVTTALQAAILAVPFVDDVVDLAGDRSWVAFALSMLVGGIAELLTFVYVAAAVSRVVDRDAEHGHARADLPGVDDLRRLIRAVVRATVIVGLLLLSIVGIPFAIRQLVRYQFAPQAIALEGCDGRTSLHRSNELVRGRWWWTAALVIGVEVVVTVIGFGAAIAVLLTVTSMPLWAFNLVSGLIYLVLVPIAAAAITFAYGNLVATTPAAGAPEPVDAERVG